MMFFDGYGYGDTGSCGYQRPRSCACPIPPVFTISGMLVGLTDPSNLLVQFTINGVSGSTVTDANGNYSISAPRGANVTVTPPTVAGFNMTPTNYQYTCLTQAMTDQNFTYSNAGQIATISGGLLGLGCSAGLPLRLIVNGMQQTVHTNAQGQYVFQAPIGSTLVITPPTQDGYRVAPLHHFLARVIASTPNLNFQYMRDA